MKTQIIQLNQNDDYISVRDKMSWSQTRRILLVWPNDGHALNRQLDLILISRFADKLGAQLAFLSGDSEVLYIAHQLGIPVLDNLRYAQDTNWQVSLHKKRNLQKYSRVPEIKYLQTAIHPQHPNWLEHSIVKYFSLILSSLSLLALVLFFLPGAKVTLYPQTEIQSMRFDLSADPSSTSINPAAGRLPTYSQSVIVGGQDSIKTTGSVVIPDQPALANLQFTNISTGTVIIPTGTVVTTQGDNPIRFITSLNDDQTVNPHKSIMIPARAIKPGPSGNLPSNRLVLIEGEIGLKLTATNPVPTSGGTDISYPSPSEQDLQSLRDHLRFNLTQTALSEIQSSLSEADTLITPSLSILDTLVETYTPSLGEPGDQLILTQRIRAQSQIVSGKTLISFLSPVLNSNTPIGFIPLTDQLDITRLGKLTIDRNKIAHWSILVQRKLKVDIPQARVAKIIEGRTTTQAIHHLSESYPLIADAQITLFPRWWLRLPFLPMRIQVVQSESQ